LGAINNNIVDTVASDFTPLTNQLDAFEFTIPYLIETVVAVAPRIITKNEDSMTYINEIVKSSLHLFNMFDLNVWIIMALVLAVSYACLFFVNALARRNHCNVKRLCRRGRISRFAHKLINRISIETHRSTASIILATGICLLAVIMSNLYQVRRDRSESCTD
jgi:hypothetical protein